MGMAASQGRFLQLTSRKNDIGLQLTRLSNEKVTLSREMRKVSSDYRESLNTKTLKWSNNAGVSYIDLSYANLMKPSAMNLQQPYLLTSSAGAVVIAANYQKYAEMISLNGTAGGDYMSNRTQILSELAGVDSTKLESSASYQADLDAAQANLDTLYNEKERNIDPLLKKCKGDGGTAGLLKNLGSTTGGGSFDGANDWADAYNNGKTIKISGSSELTGIGNQLKSLAKFFPDIDTEKFNKGIDNTISGYQTSIANGDVSGAVINGKSGEYTVNVKGLVEQALSAAGASVSESNGYTGSNKVNYEWYDTSKSGYSEWQSAHDAWHIKEEEGLAQYRAAETALAGVLTADEQSLIDYYDAIFTAIADKGWTYNEKVTDKNYLNEMLQNGTYTLTTMQKSVYADGQNDDGSAKFAYEYSTDIAANNKHVYTVNDTDVQNLALEEYEHKKSIINSKETRIDTRMKDLETEQSAIQQMLQGLEQVRNDNIERNFSVFG